MDLKTALNKIAELEAVVKNKNKELSMQQLLLEKMDFQLEKKDLLLKTKDIQLGKKDTQLEKKDIMLENKNRQLNKKNLLLKKKELQLKKKELQLKKKDDLLKEKITIIYNQNLLLNKLLSDNCDLETRLKRHKIKEFIPKNEKLGKIVINEVEEVAKETRKANRKTGNKAGRKKGGKNFMNFDFSKATYKTVYEKPDSLICERCNTLLVLATSKERFVIKAHPATVEIIKYIKESYKCPVCSKENNKIYYPLSESVFPGSCLTPSLAAHILYYKYELGIPFHHLAKHFSEHLNIQFSKQLLSKWMIMTAEKLMPLFEKMKIDLKENSARVIHSDETTLVVSKRPEEDKNRKKSYVYVYSTSYYSKQIQIYNFQETRSIDQTTEWLKDYKGYIVCDDYPGYTKLARINEEIKLQRCWVHARRKFVDILKILKESERKETTTYKILTVIDELFKKEAEYRKADKNPDEILDLRKKEHPEILKRIEDLVFSTQAKAGSDLEKALNYVKKLFKELCTYLESGYIEISNNLAERAVKPFVINRKAFMTSGSYAGAKYTTVLFSLARTAYINNLDIAKYMTYALENIGKLNIEEILPYSEKLPDYLRVKY